MKKPEHVTDLQNPAARSKRELIHRTLDPGRRKENHGLTFIRTLLFVFCELWFPLKVAPIVLKQCIHPANKEGAF
jgi:hypothetical protein